LVRELRSSVDYYQNTLSPDEKIEQVILFSDNEALTDIAERVKELLELSLSAHGLSELAATGAAIREVRKDAGTTINFLLTSRGTEVVSLRKRAVMLLFVTLSVALLALGARTLLQMQAESVEAELISLQERQAISEAQALQHIPLLRRAVSSLNAQIDVTNAAMNSITWGDQAKLMEEIRRVIPDNVWLINLRWSGSNVTFEGFGLTWQDAFDFRTALLDHSPYISSLDIDYISDVEIGNREVARFQFQCGIRRDLLGRDAKQE
jgi:Tfp pilus assembly protein PilN